MGAERVEGWQVQLGHGDIEERKRRTYLFAAGVALPFLPLIGVVQRDEELGTLPLYVALTVGLSAVWLGLATRRVSVRWAERAVLTVLPVVVLTRLAVTSLDADTTLADLRPLVAETAAPTLIAGVLMAFLVFDDATARRWGAAVWFGFTSVLAPSVVAEVGAEPSAAVAVLRQSLTLLVVVALASFLASIKADLAATRAHAETWERLARTDALTGALNRRGGTEAVAAAVAHATRYGGPVTVAVVDLDRLKERNDTLGHAEGDRALRAVVDVIDRDLRATDRLARWGGDELLVLMPGTTAADAHAIVERWRRHVAGAASAGPALSVSTGVAQHEPGETVDELVGRADAAMYRAKRAGGDTTVVAPRAVLDAGGAR